MGDVGIRKSTEQKDAAVKQQKQETVTSLQSPDFQQRRQKGMIENSPVTAAQRKVQESCFGLDALPPVQKKENKTGMPDVLKVGMEEKHGADFSDVRIHAASSKAPEVGALAYTQGSDIHFSSGQFSPDTAKGKSLLGHELTHVVQQREGRVTPTTEVAGMAVNDSPHLEKEADDFGKKTSDL